MKTGLISRFKTEIMVGTGVIAALIFSNFMITYQSASYRDEVIAAEYVWLNEQSSELERTFSEALNDLFGLARMVSTESALEPGQKQRLQLAFETLLNSDPRYFQARLIGEDGSEQIRVERQAEEVRIAPASVLQDKAGREYVERALELAPGEVYVSALELNIEQGKVVKPYQPTFRMAFRYGGALGGFLVVNLDATDMLNTLAIRQGSTVSTFLVNGAGTWFKGPAPDLEWGTSLAHQATLFQHVPELPDDFLTSGQGQWKTPDGTLWLVLPMTRFEDRPAVKHEENWFLLTRLSPSALEPGGLLVTREARVAEAVLIILLGVALVFFLRSRRLAVARVGQAELERRVAESLSDRLIEEVAGKTRSLKQLNESLELRTAEAEAAVAAKSAFLANMSHEIRTPMNAILGILVLLEDARLPERSRRLVVQAYQASEALLRVLNDILDFSKIDAGAIQIEQSDFKVETLIRRSVDLFSLAAQQKGLTLLVTVAPSMPDKVQGDLLRVSQIVSNLVGNAIKFTDRGTIKVAFTILDEDNAAPQLQINVEDTGRGISEVAQGEVFESFQQASDGINHETPGTGLGLTISRRLARLMKGDLTVSSQVDQGSRFKLSLPTVIPADSIRYCDFQTTDFPVMACGLRDDCQAFFEQYREVWNLKFEAAPTLADALARYERRRQSNRLLLIVDAEGVSRNELDALFDRFGEANGQMPASDFIVLAPTTFDHPGLDAFLQQGGALCGKPVTPSQVYDALAGYRKTSVHREAANVSAFTTAQPPDFSQVKVLVVDDLAINREVACQLLARYGIVTKEAATGEETLEKVRTEDFDLVLLDICLERESGHDVAQAIRELSLDRQPLIVAQSASILTSDRERAELAGMDDYLIKPILPPDLERLLAKSFGQPTRRQGRETEVPLVQLPTPINPAAFERQMAGDIQMLNACIRSFVTSQPELGQALREIYNSKERQIEPALDAVHKLKGASANIGDTTLRDLAQAVEIDLQSEQPDWHQFSLLMKNYAAHCNELEQYLAKLDKTTETEIDHDTLAEALTRLKRIQTVLARRGVVSESDLQVLCSRLENLGHFGLATQLHHTLEQYSYQAAEKQLIEIEAVFRAAGVKS